MENEVHDFPLRGVKITLPSEYTIRSYYPPLEVGIGGQGPGVFSPIRVMYDFEILYRKTREKTNQVNVTLRVYFTSAERDSVIRDGKLLKLAFWDEAKTVWVVIQQNNEQFIDGTPEEEDYVHHGYSGYIEAHLNEWSDPPIALGS